MRIHKISQKNNLAANVKIANGSNNLVSELRKIAISRGEATPDGWSTLQKGSDWDLDVDIKFPRGGCRRARS